MANSDIITPTESGGAVPVVRTVRPDDLKEVLRKGVDDFLAMPTHVIFICLIYPVIGILLARAEFGFDIVPLLYPLASGFALLGPFAAIGLYELSRRREAGMDTTWSHAFDVVHSPSFPRILALGGILLLIFGVWIAVAHAIYVANFGFREPSSLLTFLNAVLTTPQGLNLIIIGNLVGFLFAVTAFVLSVVSFPLLLDRHVGIGTALSTSLQVVLRNPVTMAMWGVIVAGGLIMGSLPFFLGLPIVMPVLGHASWHLYRKAVEPDPSPRPEYHPRERGTRYAADFPASLFAGYKRK